MAAVRLLIICWNLVLSVISAALFLVPANNGQFVYDFPTNYRRCGDGFSTTSTSNHSFADEQNEKCYQLVQGKETYWADAEKYCKSLVGPLGTTGEGHLAVFNSSGAMLAVQNWLKTVDSQDTGVWIGATRCSLSTTGFCWSDDGKNSNNNNSRPVPEEIVSAFWSKNSTSESSFLVVDVDCVLLHRLNEWKALTYPCSVSPWQYPFICQFQMLPLSPTAVASSTVTTTKPKISWPTVWPTTKPAGSTVVPLAGSNSGSTSQPNDNDQGIIYIFAVGPKNRSVSDTNKSWRSRFNFTTRTIVAPTNASAPTANRTVAFFPGPVVIAEADLQNQDTSYKPSPLYIGIGVGIGIAIIITLVAGYIVVRKRNNRIESNASNLLQIRQLSVLPAPDLSNIDRSRDSFPPIAIGNTNPSSLNSSANGAIFHGVRFLAKKAPTDFDAASVVNMYPTDEPAYLSSASSSANTIQRHSVDFGEDSVDGDLSSDGDGISNKQQRRPDSSTTMMTQKPQPKKAFPFGFNFFQDRKL